MNANMNTSYQSVANYEGSVSRRRAYTQAPHSAVKTSGDVQQKGIPAPKDEVQISRTAQSGAESRTQAAEDQAADFQSEHKPKLQMKSGILSSSDKTFIQLAGQYRDLTKDRSTWPSIKGAADKPYCTSGNRTDGGRTAQGKWDSDSRRAVTPSDGRFL